jgi:hypothetical protein
LIVAFVVGCGESGGFVPDSGMGGPGDGGVTEDAGMNRPMSPMMSFFVTSTGSGANGGNLGGLDGADQKCQSLGGLGKTWRAYLGTSDAFAGGVIVHPRDRIGAGPWFNYYGDMIAASVDELHSAGPDSTRVFTELGTSVPKNEHDILTGADETGMVRSGDTCVNWTESTDMNPGFVGHSDWSLPDTQGVPSWLSSHRALGCSEATLLSTAGNGRIYCFAID